MGEIRTAMPEDLRGDRENEVVISDIRWATQENLRDRTPSREDPAQIRYAWELNLVDDPVTGILHSRESPRYGDGGHHAYPAAQEEQ